MAETKPTQFRLSENERIFLEKLGGGSMSTGLSMLMTGMGFKEINDYSKMSRDELLNTTNLKNMNEMVNNMVNVFSDIGSLLEKTGSYEDLGRRIIKTFEESARKVNKEN